jgi:acyl-CoA thioester hydrolase
MKKTLQVEIPVKVRFSDTDAMGVVWHGNYLRFFEDAREAFGLKYHLSYLDIYHKGFFTPIVKSSVEHKSPINYGEEVVAVAKFHPTPSAKIMFDFDIINKTTGKISAKGHTTQVFLNVSDRVMELVKPDFYIEWEKNLGIHI